MSHILMKSSKECFVERQEDPQGAFFLISWELGTTLAGSLSSISECTRAWTGEVSFGLATILIKLPSNASGSLRPDSLAIRQAPSEEARKACNRESHGLSVCCKRLLFIFRIAIGLLLPEAKEEELEWLRATCQARGKDDLRTSV